MRVDKYLWCVRFFKTRSLATNACKQGKVKIQGVSVKPSREVYATDKVSIRKDQIDYEIEVLDLPASRVGAKIAGLYVQDITPKEAFEKMELLKYSKEYYRKKGTGRPTKKDRRDIDELLDNTEEKNKEESIKEEPQE
ncbi:RNA-binding S4 domain-containing protein [Antarcticibacterium arcticum]|uniref:RNA-binding S4 domain-containing protein n=1 Tax=Antarcticibacterium arcticum TaxID=2585771 RepID=A0A5B8YFJ8_9FLAO|nr:RNA-binding S4 domain-containing protein [Antarcticibacterium arcticum]QED36341.1 RNA-binding S4 domain-containing protein [Antarcticibacterium arcticum]